MKLRLRLLFLFLISLFITVFLIEQLDDFPTYNSKVSCYDDKMNIIIGLTCEETKIHDDYMFMYVIIHILILSFIILTSIFLLLLIDRGVERK